MFIVTNLYFIGRSLVDVRKLLSDGLLTDQLVTGIARVFNNKTGRVITTPSGHKVI